jgi:RNA polymerase sigma-70 factor (ECF subfamily)
MEGKSYRDISRITGVSLGTVKSRMHRAREAFRDHLDPAAYS